MAKDRSPKQIRDMLNIPPPVSVKLNSRLVEQQKLTKKDQRVIQELHLEREELFARMEETQDRVKLHQMADELQELEFKLQSAWKFKKDVKMHSWWFQAPNCTCPKIDNRDNIGTELRTINKACLVHGD